ncbi:GNAT family N-acetyltransferase [Neobacillus sp. PS3-34]|uniref:GNAT family N-acetyltransferase n=1 Tax=Neobacillus sp. PS3-34 TaxID=3070678 RepID=UPI0027E18D0E|nr:GNAT family N-acetyltransferase [Neobacillus sp. PS3-34]WML48808.1 GNAT family N-acetyltransferase [Neobacillus sp. PS3-34]
MKDKMVVQQIDSKKLEGYAEIPISFEVKKILQVELANNGLGGIQLIEQDCTPYIKDYDLDENAHPLNWPGQFDLDKWGLFVVVSEGMYVGGAAIAPQMTGMKKDMAVLWDLRVHPDFRNNGVGGKLLDAAILWAKAQNHPKIMVETQNINVSACKFYSRKGFSLGTIDIQGYSDSPVENEIKLLWYMDL